MAHTTGMIPGIYQVWQNQWHIPGMVHATGMIPGISQVWKNRWHIPGMAHTTGMIPGIYKVWQNRWHIPANKGYNGGRRPVSSPGFSDLSIASKIRGLVLIAPMCAKDRATRFHKRQVWWWYVNIIIIVQLFFTRPTCTISHQSIYFSIHPGQGLGSRVKRHQFSKKAGNHLNLTLPLDVYK